MDEELIIIIPGDSINRYVIKIFYHPEYKYRLHQQQLIDGAWYISGTLYIRDVQALELIANSLAKHCKLSNF
jgi:hypothetical protein